LFSTKPRVERSQSFARRLKMESGALSINSEVNELTPLLSSEVDVTERNKIHNLKHDQLPPEQFHILCNRWNRSQERLISYNGNRLFESLCKLNGVHYATVNLVANQLSIVYDQNEVTEASLLHQIQKLVWVARRRLTN
jgi:hypothetical protein